MITREVMTVRKSVHEDWKWNGIFFAVIGVIMLLGLSEINANAASYSNPDTGYKLVVEDDADLLTSAQESGLQQKMQEITIYGNVAFKTIEKNTTTTRSYIENYYSQTFGADSGTVFLIDMDNRKIWIYSRGQVYKTITDAYADTITDNVYTYASDGDYYTCAWRVYEQEMTLLQGYKIAQPMKYISNGFLAVILALLINYFIVKAFSRAKKPTDSELFGGILVDQKLSDFRADYTHETKTYSPQSSGSSGGGSSGGGGGGHSF